MNVFALVNKFFTDRKLNENEFKTLDYQANVLEELLELDGYDVTKENRPNLKKAFEIYIDTLLMGGVITKVAEPTETDKIDAINDVIVFSLDGLLKLGYNSEMTLAEVAKEINSREGSIIDGKFEKDLSEKAKAKWYKADFTSCKI